ncbi:MAG TPA: Ran-binding zinc finger domain-containing protein [Pyrinomonadaceae bacterium]|jgi:hypothetical protein
MSNPKCPGCGLVNFASASACKRCDAPLEPAFAHAGTAEHAAAFDAPPAPAFGFEDADAPAGGRRRGLVRRALWVLGVTSVLLVGCHASLLFSSTAATYDEREQVERAVGLIEQAGFARETFLLKRLTNFRTTDNWLNSYAGHANAYASTNFPFEVVTLYPDFFRYPKDDVERAVILLHEARHLAGAGEEEACASVWRDKARLGWTREGYGETRVWQNVAELSRRHAPELFECGEDGRQDCYE